MINNRELATILAALRYWQREGMMSGGHEQDIACDDGEFAPLNADEIDGLCERLNCEMQYGACSIEVEEHEEHDK